MIPLGPVRGVLNRSKEIRGEMDSYNGMTVSSEDCQSQGRSCAAVARHEHLELDREIDVMAQRASRDTSRLYCYILSTRR